MIESDKYLNVGHELDKLRQDIEAMKHVIDGLRNQSAKEMTEEEKVAEEMKNEFTLFLADNNHEWFAGDAEDFLHYANNNQFS